MPGQECGWRRRKGSGAGARTTGAWAAVWKLRLKTALMGPRAAWLRRRGAAPGASAAGRPDAGLAGPAGRVLSFIPPCMSFCGPGGRCHQGDIIPPSEKMAGRIFPNGRAGSGREWEGGASAQPVGVVGDVVADHRLDEVVAVVVVRVPAQGERLLDQRACRFEHMGVQLLGEEGIRHALVHQDAVRVGRGGLALHEHGGVVRLPGLAGHAEVAAEGLVAPGALGGRADRRDGRQGAEHAAVAQGQRDRAMAAHGVAHEAQARRVDREHPLQQRDQFLDDVAFHAPVALPRLLGGVEVEAGPDAEVPFGVGALEGLGLRAARAGIGRDEGDAPLGGEALGARLDHEGFLGAGQPREVHQGGHLAPGFSQRRGREVHPELHRETDFHGGMPVETLGAAEAGVLAQQLQAGHLGGAGPARGRFQGGLHVVGRFNGLVGHGCGSESHAGRHRPGRRYWISKRRRRESTRRVSSGRSPC